MKDFIFVSRKIISLFVDIFHYQNNIIIYLEEYYPFYQTGNKTILADITKLPIYYKNITPALLTTCIQYQIGYIYIVNIQY